MVKGKKKPKHAKVLIDNSLSASKNSSNQPTDRCNLHKSVEMPKAKKKECIDSQVTTSCGHKDITQYFSPARSPITADDAEILSGNIESSGHCNDLHSIQGMKSARLARTNSVEFSTCNGFSSDVLHCAVDTTTQLRCITDAPASCDNSDLITIDTTVLQQFNAYTAEPAICLHATEGIQKHEQDHDVILDEKSAPSCGPKSEDDGCVTLDSPVPYLPFKSTEKTLNLFNGFPVQSEPNNQVLNVLHCRLLTDTVTGGLTTSQTLSPCCGMTVGHQSCCDAVSVTSSSSCSSCCTCISGASLPSRKLCSHIACATNSCQISCDICEISACNSRESRELTSGCSSSVAEGKNAETLLGSSRKRNQRLTTPDGVTDIKSSVPVSSFVSKHDSITTPVSQHSPTSLLTASPSMSTRSKKREHTESCSLPLSKSRKNLSPVSSDNSKSTRAFIYSSPAVRKLFPGVDDTASSSTVTSEEKSAPSSPGTPTPHKIQVIDEDLDLIALEQETALSLSTKVFSKSTVTRGRGGRGRGRGRGKRLNIEVVDLTKSSNSSDCVAVDNSSSGSSCSMCSFSINSCICYQRANRSPSKDNDRTHVSRSPGSSLRKVTEWFSPGIKVDSIKRINGVVSPSSLSRSSLTDSTGESEKRLDGVDNVAQSKGARRCRTANVESMKSKKLNKSTANKDRPVTEFFPIRRSERKPTAKLLHEKYMDVERKILEGKEEGLKVEEFAEKGRGVVTTRLFRKGEFVVEYAGDLLDLKDAKLRESKYAQDTSKGCYMYYFNFNNVQYCIDGTEETGLLGRLVNHSRNNNNLVTKCLLVAGKPRLILLAKHDILPGTEVLYDYGDRSKEALANHPWLAF